MLCDQIGIQRCTQISNVHSSGRPGGTSCSYFTHAVSPLSLHPVYIVNCNHTHNQHSSLIIQPQIKMCNKRMCLCASFRRRSSYRRRSFLHDEKRRIVHTCIDTAPLLICGCLVHKTLLLLSAIQLETLVLLHGSFL